MKKLMMVIGILFLLNGLIGCVSAPAPKPVPAPKTTQAPIFTPKPTLAVQPTPTAAPKPTPTPAAPAPTVKPKTTPLAQEPIFSGKIQDPKGDVEIDFIDILRVRLNTDGETVIAEIELANIPDVSILNKEPEKYLAYQWTIIFDIDGNSYTGSDSWHRGAEYLLLAFHIAEKPTPFSGSLLDNSTTSLIKASNDKDGVTSWGLWEKGFSKIEGNKLIIQGEIPEINERTRWWIETLYISYWDKTKRQITDRAPDEGYGMFNKEYFLKQQLAKKFAPILYLHPEEVYEPKDVRIMIDQAVVRDKTGNIKIDMERIPPKERLTKLGELTDPEFYLDFKRISLNDGAGRYAVSYANLLKDHYKTTVYARVVQVDNKTVIQYWFFYFFNDWHNKHEGDWEQITLVFKERDLQSAYNSTPEIVAYSQHTEVPEFSTGGTREDWNSVEKEGTHPIVYAALGSHANYFKIDKYPIDLSKRVKLAGMFFAVSALKDFDTVGAGKKLSSANYQLIFISKDSSWVKFQGLWGEKVSDNLQERIKLKKEGIEILDNGPESPVRQNAWKNPVEWSFGREDDSDYWQRLILK